MSIPTVTIDGERYALTVKADPTEIFAFAVAMNPHLHNAQMTVTEDGSIIIQRRPAPNDTASKNSI